MSVTVLGPPGTPPTATVTYDLGPAAAIGVEDLLKLARQYGAERITMPDGLSVSLWPAVPAAPEAQGAPPEVAEPPAKAPCGHELYEQSDAGCLHGCPVPEAQP